MWNNRCSVNMLEGIGKHVESLQLPFEESACPSELCGGIIIDAWIRPYTLSFICDKWFRTLKWQKADPSISKSTFQ